MPTSVAERVHALIRAVPPGPVSARNRALLVLLAAGGLRLEEAQRLRTGDVCAAAGTVTVRDRRGRPRATATLDPLAAAVVDVWLHERDAMGHDRDAPLLCTLAGGRVSDAYVRKLLATLAQRAGVAPFTTRTLRYTLAAPAAAAREVAPVG
ncbi:MAG TPA: tyrosine-type recombinase/integrase [Miltoncostaea sp.]|nr:tyrosine-type recombinase/integrase [Miltoncostaea sp.]